MSSVNTVENGFQAGQLSGAWRFWPNIDHPGFSSNLCGPIIGVYNHKEDTCYLRISGVTSTSKWPWYYTVMSYLASPYLCSVIESPQVDVIRYFLDVHSFIHMDIYRCFLITLDYESYSVTGIGKKREGRQLKSTSVSFFCIFKSFQVWLFRLFSF